MCARKISISGYDDILSVKRADGLLAYQNAYMKEFRTNTLPRTEHVRDIHIQDQKKNNNIQERLNGEFRDREKTFRGLSRDDSPSIPGMAFFHNFIRLHMGLGGETPAYRAGIDIRGEDKWKTIIEHEALERRVSQAQVN